jgi:hypothetical protein
MFRLTTSFMSKIDLFKTSKPANNRCTLYSKITVLLHTFLCINAPISKGIQL